MKPFDFNVHPRLLRDHNDQNDIGPAVISEFCCRPSEIIDSFRQAICSEKWNDYISGFNCMIFSDSFSKKPSEAVRAIQDLRYLCIDNGLNISFTILCDPRYSSSYIDLLSIWKRSGVSFIKFHSYHQKIDAVLIQKCLEIATIAESLNLGICIDASYGSLGMFKYDNLLLASEILECIKKVPVIILHAGGLRCYEAALLVNDTYNGYLELSFSPHYYKGTSVFKRFVDVVQMLPSDRLLYASDYPYITHSDSLECADILLREANLGKADISQIMNLNALKLIGL